MTRYLHGGLDNIWVFAHAQVVITAPDGDVSTFLHGDTGVREVFGRGEIASIPSQHTEVAVGVVLLFGINSILEECLVV